MNPVAVADVARALPCSMSGVGTAKSWETGTMATQLGARALLGAVVGGAMLLGAAAQGARAAEDTIKVGILHSLSGTMAISETTLKDVMLMLIDEQNKKGGLLGKKLEAVVVDPASQLAAVRREGARAASPSTRSPRCSAAGPSVSRKSVLPVFEELNGILFYPVQYEGEEILAQRLLHRRRAEPAGDPGGRLPDERGGRGALGAGRHRLRLSAHDQQDPRGLPQVQGRRRPRTS